MDLRFLVQLGIIGLTFFMLINASALLVYAERKVMGFMQQRYGPYLVGPHGLLQPLADILKLLMKEELRPKGADRWLFTLAPILSVTAAFAAFATVPWGAETTLFGLLDEPVKLGAADVNVGVLVVFAITSMGVYGIVLAGWSSNSKYSLLGVYIIAGVAETNRAPFDFPEAEQELVSGYNTEYSSVRFALFPQAEYINMTTMAAVATDLYLGGWHGPFLPVEYGWIWFLVKVSAILFLYIWVRWTVPRYRYDQLMKFGWKWLFPAAVVNLILTAAAVLYFNA